MQAARQWLFVFMLTASLIGLAPVQTAAAVLPLASEGTTAIAQQAAPAQQPAPTQRPAALQADNSLELMGPTACPSGGCAGGQRIGLRFKFNLSGTNYVDAPDNIQVCVFASTSLTSAKTRAEMADNGEITGEDYTSSDTPTCHGITLTGYNLIGESTAKQLPANTPNDALRFAFRLDEGGTGSGVVIARAYAYNGSNWPLAASDDSPILNIASPSVADQVYVANDASTCGVYSPCYINSDGEGYVTSNGGLGTGLKDAIDIVPILDPKPVTISVLGNYTVKINTVMVDQAVTLSGVSDATITYTGASSEEACKNPMLELDNNIDLNSLNIDGGNCAGSRDLVNINSGSNTTVTIESNDFHNGNNAINISGTNEGKVVVQFNEIKNNQKHAIIFEKQEGNSPAEITANNIYGNQLSSPTEAQIDCAADVTDLISISSRVANHNYWGGSAPDPKTTHCTIVYAKRLGMPIAHKNGSPGVNVARVTVGAGDPQYALDNQVGYKRVGGKEDFDLYIVDHGYMTPLGPPFSLTGESPSPCSNYWDVFLAEGATIPKALELELYFKYYNKGDMPGCLAAINSTLYCNQTSNQGKYPLFWLDPPPSPSTKEGVTEWWDPVGARPENLSSGDGQTTSCNTSANEIKVTIDNDDNDWPSLSNLGYTPFLVGIPVIKSFELQASNQMVTVKWVTNNEPDVTGFRVWHGQNPNNLSPLNTELITRIGNSTVGATYSRTDTGLTNGTKYYYRLEVLRADGRSFYSALTNIVVNVATPTPTWTPTIIRPTNTQPFTPYPTNRPTSIPTKTPTPQKTWTPSATFPLFPTLTSTIDLNKPGAYDTLTAIAETEQIYFEGTETPLAESGMPGASLSQTPGTLSPLLGSATLNPLVSPTRSDIVAGESSTKANPWISLLLGLLAGLVVVGGVGRWWYSTQK